MRNFIIVLLILICAKSYSQNVLDFYLMLPDSVSVFSKTDRTKMVEKYKAGVNEYYYQGDFRYWFDTVDVKNGYLRVSGAFEGTWEMCYWKKNNGTKMIGVSEISCGPICDSRVSFYDYAQGKLIPLDLATILPQVDYNDYYDIPKIKSNNTPADFEKLKNEYSVAWTFRMPQKGLNIVVKFEPTDDINTSKYKIFYKNNPEKLELIWNNGSFTKGQHIK